MTRFRIIAVATASLVLASLPFVGAAAERDLGERIERSDRTRSAELAADAAALPASTPYRAIVHAAGVGVGRLVHRLDRLGIEVEHRYDSVGAVAVSGPLGLIHGAADRDDVAYVETDVHIELQGSNLDEWATRAGEVHRTIAGGPYQTADGEPLDGRGIGIGLIDTGIDATHPDLANRIGVVWRFNQDTPEGITPASSYGLPEHGTAVAGRLVGDGTSSDGLVRSLAPASSLSFIQMSDQTLSSLAQGLELVADHHDDARYWLPAMKVLALPVAPVHNRNQINTYDPNGIAEKLIGRIADAGVVVVVSAGKAPAFADADTDHTSALCNAPEPGVICVSEYDIGNGNDGTRTKTDHSQTDLISGAEGQPATYPDVIAPGRYVLSTKFGVAQCTSGCEPHPSGYGQFSGTSMSIGPVAGLAAVLLQIDPALAAGAVERIIERTAYLDPTWPHRWEPHSRTVDASNPDSEHDAAFGHGLIDAAAAVRSAGALPSGASPTATVIDDGPNPSIQPGWADIERVAVSAVGDHVVYRVTMREAPPLAAAPASVRIYHGAGDRLFHIDAGPAGAPTLPPLFSQQGQRIEESAYELEGRSIVVWVPRSALPATADYGFGIHVVSTLKDPAVEGLGRTMTLIDRAPDLGSHPNDRRMANTPIFRGAPFDL